MTQQARERDLSRRGLIAAGIGAAALAPAIVRAQTPPAGGHAGQRDHHPAARLRPTGAPTVYCRDPDIITIDPAFDALTQAQYRDRAPVDRRAVGRGPAWKLVGKLPGLERHPEQPPAALDRGRRPGERLPRAVEQQQRQHLRLPGPADLLRAPDAAGRALRARRLGHRAGRQLRGQAAQLAQRRGGHPDGSFWFTDPPFGGQLYEGTPDMAGGPSNPPAGSSPRSASRRAWAP